MSPPLRDIESRQDDFCRVAAKRAAEQQRVAIRREPDRRGDRHRNVRDEQGGNTSATFRVTDRRRAGRLVEQKIGTEPNPGYSPDCADQHDECEADQKSTPQRRRVAAPGPRIVAIDRQALRIGRFATC